MSAEIIQFVPRPNLNRKRAFTELERQAALLMDVILPDTAPCELHYHGAAVSDDKEPA